MNCFRPRCLPTAVGSLPHRDADPACDLVFRHLPQIPAWPQLPNHDPVENMYVQYFLRFPGASVENGKIVIDRGPRLQDGLESLYANYVAGTPGDYALNARSAAGFIKMIERLTQRRPEAALVKGQVTGPISAGLQIADRDGTPILYDDVLADALAKYIALTLRSQEQMLAQAGSRTLMVIDEPYLSALGSAFIQIPEQKMVALLGEVLSAVVGMKGIHCCGNTDWSLILSMPIDLLSFDAFDYGGTIALYAADIQSFVNEGGRLAWGIVPTDADKLARETVDSLSERLKAGIDGLVQKGLDRGEVLEASLITPACGLGSVTVADAERALALTQGLSARFRAEYFTGID